METYFLDSGLSWTMSKVLPYLIMILVGIVLWIIAKKILKSINKYLRWMLLLVIFVLPFLIYFMISPIYEGDFTNDSIEVEQSAENAELNGKN